MAVLTKRILATRIQRKLEGDLPVNVSAKFTLRYVLGYINDCIALMAKKNAEYNSQIDGVYYVNDFFDTFYSNLQTKVDTATQQKYIELPATPLGLPGNRALKSLTPTNNINSTQFKPISRSQATLAKSLCAIPNKTFYYIEDSKLKFFGCNVLTTTKFNLVMTSSGGDNLDDPLNLPSDMATELTDIVYKQLLAQTNLDTVNDGEPYDSNTIN